MKTSSPTSAYELLPLIQRPERAEIISHALRRMAETPTLFATPVCEAGCIERDLRLTEMCPRCVSRMRQIALVLGAADTVAFEVWAEDEVVGLIFFTSVTSLDATGHYVFFDRNLSDKTAVIEEAVEEMFDAGLARLTVEIPAPFASLIRHASRRLGFGGPFTHEILKSGGRGTKVRVEGVKRNAAFYDGRRVDLLILGREAPRPQSVS